MANKTLFATKNKNLKSVNTINQAGAPAYKFEDRHALAQLVVTSCFNGTYYSNAEDQLNQVLELARKIDTEFIAKAAVYSRQNALMKDAGIVLLAVLASRDDGIPYFKAIFPKIVDNVKQLCNFARVIRSGTAGRRNFGHAIRNTINKWINSQDLSKLIKGAVGQADPSLADVLKMVHTKPINEVISNAFAYLIDKPFQVELLPEDIAYFETFKHKGGILAPDMPFRSLTNCKLTVDHWTQIAMDMPWNTLRMNLNMLTRNKVFENPEVVKILANKLRSAEDIANVKAFPYQIMTTYQNIGNDVPAHIKDALHDALELSTQNVPSFEGDIVVAVDVSGSMGSPITGYRHGGSSTVTSCRDVAALFAACLLRKNKYSKIYGYDHRLHYLNLDPRDSVLTNAHNISLPGGGTNCTLVLEHLVDKNQHADAVIYFSDNQSWAEYYNGGYYQRNSNSPTPMSELWKKYKRYNPKSKLILVDLQPYTNTQISDDKDVLNVGGWSDAVFNVIHNFLYKNQDFVGVVESVVI